MNSYIIEIHPKKPEFDPAAAHLKAELIEGGEKPDTAVVRTCRLYKIEGGLSQAEVENVAHTLLVDPVIETAQVQSSAPAKAKKAAKKKLGWVLDVWPKPGVTDPVAETVEKGLRDLGFTGALHAATANRYIFPKIKDSAPIKTVAKRFLANELIHDIHVRPIA